MMKSGPAFVVVVDFRQNLKHDCEMPNETLWTTTTTTISGRAKTIGVKIVLNVGRCGRFASVRPEIGT